MKHFLKFATIIFLSAGLISIFQFCRKKPTIPAVTTLSVSEITQTTALSGGTVTDDGRAEITARGVCWGTTQSPTISFNKTNDGNGSGPFTSNLTGLNPGETYHLRAYATNSEGTGYGNEILFNTNPVLLATLTTDTANAITSSSAISGGKIIIDGGGSVIARGVCWSILANPTTADNKTTDGSGNGSYTSNLSGLLPGTLYHIRAYATNSAGTAYGGDLTFTTTVVTPTVTTAMVTSITYYSAVSGGNITSDGGSPITAKGVCWNTTGNPTILDYKTNNGTETGSFTSGVKSLETNTIYYIRAYATNELGTGYGDQIMFKTSLLETRAPNNVTLISAIGGGYIASDDGLPITARGVCWYTSSAPTLENNYTVDGSGIGDFTSNITGLTPNTTYYIRAYATNSTGTYYGNELFLKTYTSTVIDVDGNTYNTVTIGSQIWMAENLNTTRYANGDSIGTTINTHLDTSGELEPKYQWQGTYGRFYTWYAAVDSRNVCPTGWHVPTDSEWSVLTDYLGGENVAGSKLRAMDGNWYNGNNIGGTNESGFTALPGGYRTLYGSYESFSYTGFWWSSTNASDSNSWIRILYAGSTSITREENQGGRGYSVRCLKDN